MSEQFAAIRESVLHSPSWRKLGKAATDVYIGLSLKAECGAGIAWCPVDLLAQSLGYTERGVNKALAELLKAGFIIVAEPGKRGRPTRYNLSDTLNSRSVNHGSVNGGSQNGNSGSYNGNGGSHNGNHGSPDHTHHTHTDPITPGAALGGASAPVRADGPEISTAAKALSAGVPVSIPPAPTPLQAGEAQSVTSTASEFPDDDPLLKLAAWFGYGKPGEAAPPSQWKTLKPSKTNWFHVAILANDEAALSKVDPAAAEPIQVAAYAWYRLQALRIDHGLPVVRPGSDDLLARRGRSGGVLGGLLNERGLSGTLAIIVAACEHADAIIDAAQGLTSPPAFDVGLFRHKHTVRAAERFAASVGQPDYFSADDPLTQIGAYL